MWYYLSMSLERSVRSGWHNAVLYSGDNAVSADMKLYMWNQVAVTEEDQQVSVSYQKPSRKMEVYQYTRKIFGVRCSFTFSNSVCLFEESPR